MMIDKGSKFEQDLGDLRDCKRNYKQFFYDQFTKVPFKLWLIK